jgi:hypothetical protein
MNQKTEHSREQEAPEFKPEFIQMLVILTCTTLVLVFAFEHVFSYRIFARYVGMTPFPWVIAAGNTIADGLTMFSGKTPIPIPMSDRLFILLSVLTVYVIGPTLFFFAWRHRKLEKEAGEQTRTLGMWTLLFVIGGILCFTAAMPSVPIAFIQRSVSHSLHSAQAVQGNRDAIINDLNTIAWKVRQHRILPTSLNGGGGSFVGFSMSSEIAATENGRYTLVTTDSMCTVRATSTKYPTAAVVVTVDKQGRLGNWRYEGPFE